MESVKCSVRLCRNQAVAKSPITCQPLCDTHMKSDISKMEKSESAVSERISHFKKYTTPLRLMQQRLTSDLQLLDDTFHELRDTLDRCQNELVHVITAQHDQLLDSLKILSDVDDFEKELKTAKEQNDMRQAFIINESMEKSLETLQLDSQLVSMDEESQEVKMASFPDVNYSVRELVNCVDMQYMILKTVVKSLDAQSKSTDPQLEVKEEEKKLNLSGNPVCMALCSNTSGFVIKESGGVARAEAAPGCPALPQPSVFVAVKPSEPARDDTSDQDSGFKVLLLSPDTQQCQTLPCSWDAHEAIKDLHFDNQRQQLFIAQNHSVTVADLAGVLQSRISVSDLQADVQEIHAISGDSDKLFIAVTTGNGKSVIFAVSKKTSEVQLRIPVQDLVFSAKVRISVRDRMIDIRMDKKILTLCTITGHIVRVQKEDEPTVFGLSGDADQKEICAWLFCANIGYKTQGDNRFTILGSLSMSELSDVFVINCNLNGGTVECASLRENGLSVVRMKLSVN